jgi:hypothetical protein
MDRKSTEPLHFKNVLNILENIASKFKCADKRLFISSEKNSCADGNILNNHFQNVPRTHKFF